MTTIFVGGHVECMCGSLHVGLCVFGWKQRRKRHYVKWIKDSATIVHWISNEVQIAFGFNFIWDFGISVHQKKHNAMFHFQCLKSLPWITDVDIQLKKIQGKNKNLNVKKKKETNQIKNSLHCLCGIHDDNTVEKDECVFEFYTINWNENVLCVN